MAAAAVMAQAAMKRINEKRMRAYREELMTPEEKAVRDQERAQRAVVRAKLQLIKNTQIAQELATGGLPARCVEWHINFRDNPLFQTFVICVIFVAGALVGINTYEITDAGALTALLAMENTIVAIFTFEIYVKFIAEGKRPWKFFTNDEAAWNIFDFFIVVAGFVPLGGGGAIMVLRLLRLLRVLKLVKALPKLRILVIGLLKSLSAIAYIGMLLMLLFYLFAVLGVSVYGPNDPVHMGTLHVALINLFRAATMEDWTDLMYTSMVGCKNYGYDGMEELCTDHAEGGFLAVMYWCVFLVFASLMILNLFIGVITGAMEDAKEELTAEMTAAAEADDAAKEEEAEAAAKVLAAEAAEDEALEGGDATGFLLRSLSSMGSKNSGNAEEAAPVYSDDALAAKFSALAVVFREVAADLDAIQRDEHRRDLEAKENAKLDAEAVAAAEAQEATGGAHVDAETAIAEARQQRERDAHNESKKGTAAWRPKSTSDVSAFTEDPSIVQVMDKDGTRMTGLGFATAAAAEKDAEGKA